MSAKTVRLILAVSGALPLAVLAAPAVAEEPAAAILFAGLAIGPFVLYAATVRSREVAWAAGVALVLLTGWAVFRAFTDSNSTAGANLLWIPVVGYPVAIAGALFDRTVRE